MRKYGEEMDKCNKRLYAECKKCKAGVSQGKQTSNLYSKITHKSNQTLRYIAVQITIIAIMAIITITVIAVIAVMKTAVITISVIAMQAMALQVRS